jgi:hypothetical protein
LSTRRRPLFKYFHRHQKKSLKSCALFEVTTNTVFPFQNVVVRRALSRMPSIPKTPESRSCHHYLEASFQTSFCTLARSQAGNNHRCSSSDLKTQRSFETSLDRQRARILFDDKSFHHELFTLTFAECTWISRLTNFTQNRCSTFPICRTCRRFLLQSS